jgi:hypothetical protein
LTLAIEPEPEVFVIEPALAHAGFVEMKALKVDWNIAKLNLKIGREVQKAAVDAAAQSGLGVERKGLVLGFAPETASCRRRPDVRHQRCGEQTDGEPCTHGDEAH